MMLGMDWDGLVWEYYVGMNLVEYNINIEISNIEHKIVKVHSKSELGLVSGNQ